MTNWIHLADFSVKVGEQTVTLRVSKTDHPYTPYYSWKLGVLDTNRTPPNNLMPNLRSDSLSAEGLNAIMEISMQARNAVERDRAKMKAALDKAESERQQALDKAESERQQALTGKGAGDPNANTGLSRFKKKHAAKDKRA